MMFNLTFAISHLFWFLRSLYRVGISGLGSLHRWLELHVMYTVLNQ